MLCSRIKQFREYNKLKEDAVAKAIGVELNLYKDFESGKETPSIDVIKQLAKCYKVTIDEFYGYTPRLTVYDGSTESEDNVSDALLKMSDLSWEEAQLILYFRSIEEKDDIISEIIKRRYENN